MPDKAITVDQKDCMYDPHVQALKDGEDFIHILLVKTDAVVLDGNLAVRFA